MTTMAHRAGRRATLQRLRTVLALTVLGAGGAACGASTRSPSAAGGSAGARSSTLRAADPSVGPLFPTATGTVHLCTASVVDSPGHDLLLTAAHCVAGTGAGMSFAPGAVDGHDPYGRWTVTAAYAAPAWVLHHNAQADVAVLVVAPRVIDGHRVEVQDRTGGHPLGTEPAVGTTVRVTGYPFGSSDRAVTCQARVERTAGFPAFPCPGFVAGTSGGPWVTTAGAHAVVGVIGGLHQGGCRPNVSYTTAFTGLAQRVYQAAVARGPTSTLPAPGPDGC